MRKTKIVCTMGPATQDVDVLRRLLLGGMNVARFNFSHGTHEYHTEMLNNIVALRTQMQLPVATLLDTKGPEIRIGKFREGKVTLKNGQIFTLTANAVEGDESMVSITYPELVNDIAVGASVLIDDGLVAMEVTGLTATDIICRVLNDGTLSNQKGVNVPGTPLSMPFVSEQDYNDIVFGAENDFDFLAASFTRTADDILQIRKILHEHNCDSMNIIAKIENAQGVANIDEIIRVSDGIMVARGDMGVEIPLEDVPVIQKMIIKKVYNAGKQVITATQMLDSMMKNPRPTRAEINDVANAIYDGTSAIMLSGETAAGLYPVESLQTMVKIAERTEQSIDYIGRFKKRSGMENPDITNAISHATCTTAHDLGAAAILTVTLSGKTARMISKYRPACPIVGCTTNEKVYRQLSMSWGVIPLVITEETQTEQLFATAAAAAVAAGIVQPGELTVITAGMPLGVSGTTNTVKVHVAGNILVAGRGMGTHKVTAPLCVCKTPADLDKLFDDGEIIVIHDTTNEMLPKIRGCAGLVIERTSVNSHAAIAALSLNLPIILGAEHATEILKSGAIVTMDCDKGTVSSTR